MTDLAQTLLPMLGQSIQDAITTNINDEFKKVNECSTANLNKINDKLSLIGDRHERIESEFAATHLRSCMPSRITSVKKR